MASFANQLSIVFLLLLPLFLSSLHTTTARDTQFFNKVPSTTNNGVPKNELPQTQDPNFQPNTDNNYGLYGNSDAATLPPSKYLPKNYNPVAYVTVPETTNDDNNNNDDGNKFYSTTNGYDNGGRQNFYDAQQEEEDQTPYRSYTNAAAEFQPQGLSDTRSFQNGRYFYDVDAEKFSGSHPYQSLRGGRRNSYDAGAGDRYGQFNGGNAVGEFRQSQNEFQPEENFNEP
ncbi:protein E6 [Andrographis paniculata]|uniref:protein E6 n=1 Tax=Andrographis paniculata TaxID=175694 RepID=UPI0021E72BAF|nr:protein E6 [Andrographis paniculata]